MLSIFIRIGYSLVYTYSMYASTAVVCRVHSNTQTQAAVKTRHEPLVSKPFHHHSRVSFLLSLFVSVSFGGLSYRRGMTQVGATR